MAEAIVRLGVDLEELSVDGRGEICRMIAEYPEINGDVILTHADRTDEEIDNIRGFEYEE